MTLPRNLIVLAAHGAEFMEGNLAHYIAVLLTKSSNLNNGYHNLTHITYVTWKCAEAGLYYQLNPLTKRDVRKLLIAAIFHDWNHSGKIGPDREQIERAILGLRENIHCSDLRYIQDIEKIIRATEWPHQPLNNPTLSELIIREADVSQALQQTWMQQTLFGLAEEWGIDPLSVLAKQKKFLLDLSFKTEWAIKTLEPLVKEKIEDVEILEKEIITQA